MFDLATKYCFHLDKNNTKSLELFLLLYFLEKYVNGAIIEINRLEKTRKNITKKLSDIRQNISIPRKRDFWLTYLACDTHFFFICIDKVYKLLSVLSNKLNDSDIKNLVIKIDHIFNIKIVRGHLEHIGQRCLGRFPRENRGTIVRNDLGNFWGDDFSFGGKKFPSSKKSLEELKNIYLDLIKILDKRARKDPRFVEKIKMEERNKLIMNALKKAGLIKN